MRSMSRHDPWGSMYTVPVKEQAEKHHWKVEALYDCSMNKAVEYEGDDRGKMVKCVGELCLTVTVDKIFIWRDNEKYRHIEMR
jgi:hypothetical protein